MSGLAARALPALLLLLVAPVVVLVLARRWRAAVEGAGLRMAALGAMTFALASAIELGLGKALHAALENGAIENSASAAPVGLLLVGVAVALAHEPLRFLTYRHFLPDHRAGRDVSARAAAVLFGLGYGGAMAALAAFVLLTGFGMEAVGGEGMRALGFGADAAHQAEMREAFGAVEPWRPWLTAADQLAWVLFHVGLTWIVARGGFVHLLGAFALHAAMVAAVLAAGEASLQLETAAHGAAALLGVAAMALPLRGSGSEAR